MNRTTIPFAIRPAATRRATVLVGAVFALTLLAPFGVGRVPAFAAAPPLAKTKSAKKPTTRKALAKKADPRKRTRLTPKPLPKPTPKPSPVVIIPAPKPSPAPVPDPAPRPVPAPVPVKPTRTPTSAQLNAPIPVGGGTFILEKVETTDKALPNLLGLNLPDTGTHYIVFTMRVKNEMQTPLAWSLEKFNPQLQTSGGGQVIRGIDLMTAKNDKFEKQPIQPGEEKELRFHFQVPQGAVPQTLILGAVGGPAYQFDVSGVR